MGEARYEWRKPRSPEQDERPVVGAHAYRAHFASRGKAVLGDSDSYGARRIATFAPFAILPAGILGSRRLPATYRPAFWVATFFAYGIASTVMYNTDASSDADPSPALIRFRTASTEDVSPRR